MTMGDDKAFTSAYAELARPRVPAEEPVAAVRGRLRQRAQRRRGLAALAIAGVVAVVGVGIHIGAGPSSAGGADASGAAAAPPTGALRADTGGLAQSCAVGYTPQTLGQREWAADATVTRIGGGSGTVTVDLAVHTWFRGGSGDSLEVRLPSPRAESEDEPPRYAVDTRLLLSGSRSNGGWQPSACGFTRYYDDHTAAVWAKVFSR
ncbi:hypothetical protein [uncultured Friedmanniella sp.]|uniref:hypothetical protein n=1 Tax=uncultured Friedmanniella sp. TaxID=335381 RepID=UPI0035CA1F7F